MVKQAWAWPLSAALVAGTGLAACSNSSGPSLTPTTTTTTAPYTSKDTIVPMSVPNQPNVRKDVRLLNCAQSSGGWSAGGAVANTRGKSATYTITVFFTSAQATDLAYATTKVTVDNGKNALWSAKATFAAPAGTLCVLRGVAAS
jgi:putative hemolysin